MSTTSKLGADMRKEILDKLYELRPSDNDRGRHHFQRVADDIRAILARQPAAIDKQEAVAWTSSTRLARIKKNPGHVDTMWGEALTHDGDDNVPLYATPLANEASKPTPSVEHDERGAFEAEWKRSGWGDADTKNQCFHFWQARAASTSANGAQGAEAVAWFTDDSQSDKSATTWDRNVAERWRTKGWPVSPIYAAPPAQTALTEDARDAIANAIDLLQKLADKQDAAGFALTASSTRRVAKELAAAQSASGDTK